MNLPQAHGYGLRKFLASFFCTTERVVGEIEDLSELPLIRVLTMEYRVRGRAAILHNALIGQLWIQGGFFARLYYKKVLCKHSFGLCIFGAKPLTGRIGVAGFLFCGQE